MALAELVVQEAGQRNRKQFIQAASRFRNWAEDKGYEPGDFGTLELAGFIRFSIDEFGYRNA